MPYPIFPITRSPHKDYYKQQVRKPQLKSSFEAGYVQSRPKGTRSTWIYETGWKDLSDTEYQNLIDFFTTNQGSIFTWVDPLGNSKLVRFSEDSLPANVITSANGGRKWDSGSIKLEEA